MLARKWHSLLLVLGTLYYSQVSALPPPSFSEARPNGKPTPANDKANVVYFMTNAAENAIVALRVAPDGTIESVGSITPTGGIGGNLVSPVDLTPDGPDALGSQGSVQVEGNVSLLPIKLFQS